MRTLLLATATLALPLAACNKDQDTATTAASDEVSFEQEEQPGDVTAIDAATDYEAGMAPAESLSASERAPAPVREAAPRPSAMDEAIAEPAAPAEPAPVESDGGTDGAE